MSTIIDKQPYAPYPLTTNPYTKPKYKEMAKFDKTKPQADMGISAPQSCQPRLVHSSITQGYQPRFQNLKRTLQEHHADTDGWLLSKKMILHSRIKLDPKLKKTSVLKPPQPNLHLHLEQTEDPIDGSDYVLTGVRLDSASTRQCTSRRRCWTAKDQHTTTPLSSIRRPLSAQVIPVCSVESTIQPTVSLKSFQSNSDTVEVQLNTTRPNSAPATFHEHFNDQPVESITSSKGDRIKKASSIMEEAINIKNDDDNSSNDSSSTDQLADRMDNNQRSLAYDAALKHYGWRMEMPGDPFKLKRPFLSKRLSYAVPIKPMDTLPPPPVMRVRKTSTFFQPTIQYRPLSFTIHPDWASEAFVAKQNALRGTGNWLYGSSRYAFAY